MYISGHTFTIMLQVMEGENFNPRKNESHQGHGDSYILCLRGKKNQMIHITHNIIKAYFT